MEKIADSLLDKTDAELIAMVVELSIQMDRIGQEQSRRIATERRQIHASQDAQENEGGLSP